MPDFATLLPVLLLLLFIGGIAGVMAGLLGVGGGIVLVPAFYYTFTGLGYDNPQIVQVCLATSLATIIFTSIRSVLSHHKKGAVDWKILRDWAPGIAVGAVIGVLVASGLQSNTLVLLFGVLAIFIGFYMAFGKSEWRLGSEMPGLLGRSIVSPGVGFLSVLMGIGGGSFGVPIMTLHGVAIHRAVATAAGFGLTIALPSVIAFMIRQPSPENLPPFMIGYVNVAAFFVVVSMTTLTAPIGVSIAHRTDPKPLKKIFAIFLIAVALNMLRKATFG